MTRGLRWSEADLRRYQASRGHRVNAPAPRLAVPGTSVVRMWPGQYHVYVDNLRTQTEKNSTEHWWTRARRASAQRRLVYRCLQDCLGLQCPIMLPAVITLTRISPGTLDGFDNLQSALAHCVDAVADYLAGGYLQGNDRQPRLTWGHGQRRGGLNQYGVEIRLEGRERT